MKNPLFLASYLTETHRFGGDYGELQNVAASLAEVFANPMVYAKPLDVQLAVKQGLIYQKEKSSQGLLAARRRFHKSKIS